MPENVKISHVNYNGTTYDIKDAAHGTLTAQEISTGTSTDPKFISASVLSSVLSTAGQGTVTSVALTNATNESDFTITGSPITNNGTFTIVHANSVTPKTGTPALYPITFDKHGHITGSSTAVSVPTKVSDLTNDTGFITGGSNSSSAVTIVPTTDTVYSVSSIGTLPALSFAKDTTDTLQLNISWSQGTLPATPVSKTVWTGYSSATAGAQSFTGTNNIQSVGGNTF